MLDQDINRTLLECTKYNFQEKQKPRMDIIWAASAIQTFWKAKNSRQYMGYAITSDSTFIFSGSDDNLINIWNIPSSASSGD